ncbi:OVARIAN TUMOR DOMAIN-containing deubiquitinating enzyme 4-like isoform X1 [Amaranthus tricolor]|uniref:OVARIAN TUMOR DOMAIN-containing deubiquitinating enzyme 4-like isoform X1 n=1 Tax=Amaranthus tricolor TaxID=29722 RepID=UPI0025853BFD|nr:OVARIAN TUMOR DOMAIN-containing deubiquitinating enzyme 4-like isoform X1 [Amaranthus tricolor]XP_057541344.1 OVARIAN TUMOR DOMAIN-containing deubiquitinating enzyme 4-like isoform X1 [Amaranthus tricolor]XP_057541345.1 OVARIAN TUMOR DOMAIN-containing deubiquitinating enzyme 4-like isoform X1 [Amaranthus tricolor]
MMIVCSPIKTCPKNVLPISGYFQKQMRVHINNIASPTTSRSCCHILKQGISRIRYPRISASSSSSWFSNCSIRAFQWVRYRSGLCSKKKPCPLLMVKSSSHETSIGFSSWPQDVSIKILVPKRRMLSDFKFDAGLFSWLKGYGAAGLISGLLVCYSTSNSAHSEALEEKGAKKKCTDPSVDHFAHGKKVYTDYSVIGIPGDGRCLFRSVAHGACLRNGKPAPNESLQKQLADELRAMVAEELIRRRQETEWFIEGDFDTYVSRIRKPHVWGGEPELLMLQHVLRMPITVYMHDNKYGGLISIAEYGQVKTIAKYLRC